MGEVVQRQVLPLLEIAIGMIEGDLCGGLEDLGSFEADRDRLAELAARNDELWAAEATEDDADTPAVKGVRS